MNTDGLESNIYALGVLWIMAVISLASLAVLSDSTDTAIKFRKIQIGLAILSLIISLASEMIGYIPLIITGIITIVNIIKMVNKSDEENLN
jgi:hypothetical protein